MKRLLALGTMFLLLLVVGCRSGTGAGGGAAKVTTLPDFKLDSLKVVAFVGLGHSVTAENCVDILEPILEGHLLGAQLPFVMLPKPEVAARANRAGAANVYREVSDFWRDSKKVDKFKLEELCSAVGAQAILVGSIDEWERTERASWNADEPAYTRITARMCIYPSETGRWAWRARVAKTVEAETYEGSRSTSRPDGSAAISTHGGADAPRFEDVSVAVAKDLTAAIAKPKK